MTTTYVILLIMSVCIFAYMLLSIIVLIINRSKKIKIGDLVMFDCKIWEVIDFDLYTKDPVLGSRHGIRCPSIEKIRTF